MYLFIQAAINTLQLHQQETATHPLVPLLSNGYVCVRACVCVDERELGSLDGKAAAS